MQMLYSPVGLGAGKRALIAHDASSAGTGLGVPSASNNVPFVSSFQPTYGYPNLQFIGSDDILDEEEKSRRAAIEDDRREELLEQKRAAEKAAQKRRLVGGR